MEARGLVKLDDVSCDHCGRHRLDHAYLDHHFRLPTSALAEYTPTELRAAMRRHTRETAGKYDVYLPPPKERRRIREAAGWTQEFLGDELEVSRDTVYRWEQTAVGYQGETRLPGREPAGELREAYARLLNDLHRAPD